MVTITNRYSDIDFLFTKHPVSNDLVLSFDEQAVIRSVRNILLTNHYEVPFNSAFGSNIRKMLFEPISPTYAGLIRREIEDSINNFEPRVELQSVDVLISPDENFYRVNISFYMVNRAEPITVDFILERLR